MAGESRQSAPLASLHDVELGALAASGARDAYGGTRAPAQFSRSRSLRRMGAEAALADDLAQDAFLAGYERISEFRGEGAFAGWIKKIAARLYLKRWKRRAALDPVSDAEIEDAASDGEAGAVDGSTWMALWPPCRRLSACAFRSAMAPAFHMGRRRRPSRSLGT